MRRLLCLSLLFIAAMAAGAEPSLLSFVIHGRPSLHSQPAGSPGSGLVNVGVFEGEPILLTLTAHNAPAGDDDGWLRRAQWTVTTEMGEPVAVKLRRDTESSVQAPYAYRLRGSTKSVNLRMDAPPPGRYIVALTWTDSASGERQTARREGFAVYRGDETLMIRAWFLRDQARTEVSKGTREGYLAARTLLLQAVKDNDDPSFYEELGDISLPWAQPDETAAYYDKSLAIARANLEKTHGAENGWSENAWQLYRPRAGKAETFRRLQPEYAMKFHDVRVTIDHRRSGDVFIMEQRSNGKQLRVIELRE
jgi:hypothetical protein